MAGPFRPEGIDVDRLTDGEDDGVGVERSGGRRGRTDRGEPAVLIEHRHHTDRLQAHHLAVLGEDAGRSTAVDEADLLFGGFLELERRGRHLLLGFERDHRHVGGAGPGGGAGGVECLGHDVALIGLDVLSADCGRLIVGPAQGSAGGVHGDVATADDDDPVSYLDFETLIDVDEEFDGLEDPVRLVALDVEAAPEGGPDRHEQCVVAVLQLVERHVFAQLGVEVDVDAEVDDGLQLGIEEVTVEPVLGDPELHHAAELGGRLVDGDLIAVAAQVVGARHAGRTAADDADALRPIGPGGGGDLTPGLARPASTPYFSVTNRLSARMAIGWSISPRRQASSQGAAHTRPHTDANGFGSRAVR